MLSDVELNSIDVLEAIAIAQLVLLVPAHV